jgi:hypothetical protein
MTPFVKVLAGGVQAHCVVVALAGKECSLACQSEKKEWPAAGAVNIHYECLV